jgi:hypothetical protein
MQMGEQGSAGFKKVTEQAINARRQMEDVQDAIMAADLEGKAKLAAMGFSQATQAIAGMQGAMHLFGLSTDTAAEVTAKLQSLMAISAGIEAMVALEGTVTALARSINLAAAAQKALNFAMTASGAGIIIGVTAIIVSITSMVMAQDKAAKAAKKHADELKYQEMQLKATREATEDLSQFLDEAAEMEVLRARAAGKSTREIYKLEESLMQKRIDFMHTQARDMTRSLDERIASTGEAIKLEGRLEKMRLNEQIRLNEEKKNKVYKKDVQNRMEAFTMATRTEIQKLSETQQKPVAMEIDLDLKAKDIRGRIGTLVAEINESLDSGIKQMAVNMAGALGDLAMNIVAGAEQPLAKFGDALLSTLAGFMQTLGQAMMSAGLASQVFQKTLLTNPALAIVAGAGLVIAAGVVKGIMQRGIEGRKSPSGAGGTGETPQGIRPFADGGIISGPTLGLMGEYPGARSNPEVVAPLNKLKDMIGGGGTLTTRVSGQDLLIMLDRAETNRGRVR